jgi:hypothetical protein
MIKPTVGRVVWFYDQSSVKAGYLPDPAGQPMVGLVAHVLNDRMVNLTVSDAYGQTFSRALVPLRQEGDPEPDGAYCEWMPYQKGQAAKTEALEAKIAGG